MATDFQKLDAMLGTMQELSGVITDAFAAKHNLGVSKQTGPTSSPLSFASMAMSPSSHPTPDLGPAV